MPGLDATQYGDNWPSHWVRSVYMESFEYVDLHDAFFKDYMVVQGGDLPIHYDFDLIAFDGIESLEVGDFTMPVTHRSLSPYMIGPPCIPPHACTVSRG